MSLRLLPVSALLVIIVASCGGGASDDAAPSTTVAAATTEATLVVTTTDPPVTSPTTAIPTSVTMTPNSTAADCAFEFNATTLAERTWAFDGTLIDVGTVEDSRLGPTPSATFAVNQWYRGGTGEQVTVQYEMGMVDETAPTLTTGARLLVAGEPRWGGAPLDSAVAWGCGFTQVWTSDAAQTWTEVFSG